MVEIRHERPEDKVRVFEVEAAAFERRNEAKLADALRDSAEPHISLVAVQDETIVGHVFFSPVTIASQRAETRAAALGPVAVDPSHQGEGIGSALVRSGLERCSDHGWGAVFLVGNPAYYSRFGFVLAAPLGFDYGHPVFDTVFQVVELEPGTLDGCRGRVHFHPAFAEAE